MNANLPQILGVAIVYKGQMFALPKPYRHHNVIRFMWEFCHIRPVVGEMQGFYDDKGRFLTREEAYKLAKMNGQLVSKTEHGLHKLFSEDIW